MSADLDTAKEHLAEAHRQGDPELTQLSMAASLAAIAQSLENLERTLNRLTDSDGWWLNVRSQG
jgi:hypothetical protein